MFEVSTQELRRCDLVTPKGRIDSETAPGFGKALTTITDAGRFKIVVNLAGVEYLSSAGLRHLIAAQKTCKRWNRGELVLAEVPAKIKEVLELAGLTDLFKVYDTEVNAVGSF
jgi:anti-sigma B factor antagonist